MIQQHDPMTANIVHRLLVTSNRLQSIPPALVALLLLVFAVAVYGFWLPRHDETDALLIATVVTATNSVDWLQLWMLPRLKRSFGPDRPPALALGGLRAVLLTVVGLLALPVWVGAGVAITLTLVAIYATWIEPFRLGVTRQELAFPDWRANVPPLRLLHIGDIHIERTTARERRLNTLIRELEPDVIVFSGDFVNISYNCDSHAEADIRQILSEWSAPLGVYCVPGTYTVEPLARVRQFVDGLDNVRLLEDEWVHLDTPGGKLNILGMVTTHFLEKDRTTVKQQLNGSAPPGLRLLLTHAPDVAPEADEAGYDLYLCGHTHGGQLRLPFIGAIFSGSALGMRFVMGRYDLNCVTVYTSRGVGLEGMGAPRARFLCPPEIILWEIRGQA